MIIKKKLVTVFFCYITSLQECLECLLKLFTSLFLLGKSSLKRISYLSVVVLVLATLMWAYSIVKMLMYTERKTRKQVWFLTWPTKWIMKITSFLFIFITHRFDVIFMVMSFLFHMEICFWCDNYYLSFFNLSPVYFNDYCFKLIIIFI